MCSSNKVANHASKLQLQQITPAYEPSKSKVAYYGEIESPRVQTERKRVNIRKQQAKLQERLVICNPKPESEQVGDAGSK